MGSAIEFTVVEKTKERYWNDETFREEQGVEDLFEALDLWEAEIIDQWTHFAHHRKSGLFSSSAFGRDYSEESERYLDFPEIINGSYNDGGESSYDYPMKERLREALSYRIDKAGTKDAGWEVFDKVTGTYKINIIDNETHARRRLKLQEFLDIVHEDTKLTTMDPQTGKKAITAVDPSTSEQQGIQYFFPPHDDYSEVHYSVFEVEEKEIKSPYEDINIFELIANMVKKQIIERNDSAKLNSVMGQIMSKRKDLREMAQSGELPKMIGESLEIYNKEFEDNGIDAIKEQYIPIREELEEEIIEEGKMEQKYKIIGVKALIKKASQEIRQKLNDIRPSIGNDRGGPRWPKSGEGTYLLKISGNPFDVITKSTGRPWGWKEESCEVWYGCYKAGPVDDIKWGNPVVWLYEGEEIKPNQENLIGRMMLRWGRAYKIDSGGESKRVGIDVGIEAQTYPKQADWGNDVTLALMKILKSEGLLNYDYCKTPYHFKGYSDYKGSAGKITYERTKLKGKGEVVDETFDYLTQARDPLIGYQQLQWLIQTARREERNDIYSALCQNATLWAYPSQLTNVIRLLKRLGPNEAKQNVMFLIDSEGADLNFFDYIVEHIQDYDEDYNNYKKSLLIPILQNPNCPPALHNKIRQEFPRFKGHMRDLYREVYVGGVDEIAYLNLMGRSNHFWEPTNAFICPAPANVVAELVEKVIKGASFGTNPQGMEGAEGRKEVYIAIDRIRYPDDYGTSQEDVDFYWTHRDFLFSVRNLIYAPNITQKDFLKLMKQFGYFLGLYPNWETKYPVCARLIRGIQDAFQNCITLPFREQGDYGYTTTLPDGTFVGMGEVPIQFHYHLEERQDAESIILLTKLLGNEDRPLNYGSNSLRQPYGLLNNIRSQTAFNILWRNREAWEIGPEEFLGAGRGRSVKTMDTPTFHLYLTPSTIQEIMEAIVSLSQGIRELVFPLLERVCRFDDSIKRNYETIGTSTMVEYILMDLPNVQTQDIIDYVGWNRFALWLEKPLHFSLFENALYEYIFGESWAGVISQGGQSLLYHLSNLGTDSTELFTDEDWEKYYSVQNNIEALILAASGWVSDVGGLANNPNLPLPLLKRMIGDGDDSWLRLDERYEGTYYQYMNLLAKKLLSNPATPTELLTSLVIKYPQYENEIATNPNAPIPLLQKQKKDNPVEALCNPNLKGDEIEELAMTILDILHTPEVEGVGRLFNVLTDGAEMYGGNSLEKTMRPLHNPYSKIEKIREWLSAYNWMKYWRGGTCKSQMSLPYRDNLNPQMSLKEGREGIPQALVNDVIEEYSLEPQLIIDMDFDNELYKSRVGSEELPNMVRFRKLEEVKILPNGKIHVIGRQKTTSPENRGRWGALDEVYENMDEMYGYIRHPTEALSHSPQIEISDEVMEFMTSKSWSWRYSLTLVVVDERRDVKELPLWRRKWDRTYMNNFYQCLVDNPSTTDKTLLEVLAYIKSNEGYRVHSSERDRAHGERAVFRESSLLKKIDEGERWTSLLQRALFQTLVYSGGSAFIGNFQNCKPSSIIFEYTLLEREPDEDEISMEVFLEDIQNSVIKEGISLTTLYAFGKSERRLWENLGSRDLVNWILSEYGLQVPISYIYALMKFRVLYGESMKGRAREIQRERIPEYIAYVASLHHEGEGEGMIIEA